MAPLQRENSADVIVVGSGIAGLSAAVTAAQAGARVILLERAPREDRGGNTRWTDAYLRMKSEQEVADDFETHFMANTGHHLDPSIIQETTGDFASRSALAKTVGMTDPDVIATFAERAGSTLQWLKTFGLRFDFLPSYLITTCTPRLAPIGGGLAMVDALADWAEDNGIDVRYETSARGLIHDEDGAVVGLIAAGKENRTTDLLAPAVILACGGFEGNPEMLVHYLGGQARYLRPVARGGYYNKGEGIRMALAAGAAPSGDYSRFHAEPLDPRSGAPEPIVLIFNYGVLVNVAGERFVDEAPATVDATYEAITREIHAQPQSLAYAVFDAGIDDIPSWQRCVRSDVPPFEADTLAGLAAQIDVDADAITRTIIDYNAACPTDASAFKPLETDGLATAPGYTPRKSNWARRIAKPPFRAYPIMCGNCFTFGGLKVDPRARVLNTDGEAIPGLYAAGETMGIYYGTYTGATSVLRGAVFGRIAGEGAARQRTTS
ncbi:MAG: FAD-dependent tricarballylate dehydrogenase TcuA [Hyphomicrobiaceae bacterium]